MDTIGLLVVNAAIIGTIFVPKTWHAVVCTAVAFTAMRLMG